MNVTYQANLLDLRNKAALRGAEPNPNESAAVLPREPLALSIYLPTGSEPGDYEVQVTQGPSQPLSKAEGSAISLNHIVVLEVKIGSTTVAARSIPVLDSAVRNELELLSGAGEREVVIHAKPAARVSQGHAATRGRASPGRKRQRGR